MQRLVVGVDDSDAARDALRWSGHAAAALGAEVLAVTCFRPPYAEMPPEEHDRLLAELEHTLADTWTAPARDAGVEVRTRVVEDDPRNVLVSIAEQEAADLLVLGRTGERGGPGFLHLGSVVEHAAHHATMPLAVVPAGWSAPTEKLLVGLDGSATSLATVPWVGDYASAVGADVVAVVVREPFLEWTTADDPQNWRRDAERHLAGWTESLSSAGLTVSLRAQRDLHPADGILAAAADEGADLVVVAARGVGGFAGLRAGGVTMKVLHAADRPLVIVPEA